MKKITAVLLSFITTAVSAQEVLIDSGKVIAGNAGEKLYTAFASVYAGYTSNDVVPFWMRANKFGSVPVAGVSGSLLLAVEKKYDAGKHGNKPDWGFGVEGRINAGAEYNARFIQAYVKTKWGPFQLKAGRSRDLMGLADSTLGMGAFSMSGNALGIPKIELSFPGYWSVPFLADLIAIKGNFSIGWLGDTRISAAKDSLGGIDNRKPGVTTVNSLLHQKSLYVRFGKKVWPIQLYGGFNHQTVFGNEQNIYTNFNLTTIQSLYYAVTGKTWKASNGFRTKLGNQLGSIDAAISYRFKPVTVYVYHQFFYDVGALAHLANLKDGLTGVSIKNNHSYTRGFHFQKILFEFLYSKDQAGGLDAPHTPSGDEDYYNNYLYRDGWSYQQVGIGNPFFTPKLEAISGLPSLPSQYFINNRVVGLHAAAQWQFGALQAIGKLSYSKNFGTYGTSIEGASTGNRRYIALPPYFPELKQISASIEMYRPITKNWSASFVLAVDNGELLPNTVGGSIGLKRNLLQ